MEIQKIFTSIEDQEDRLYSVLMTEDEVALFSEFQKEFNSKAAKERNNKYFESLGTEDVRGGKTGRISYKNAKTGGFDFKLGPSSQELNKENAGIIRHSKINGQYRSAYNEAFNERDSGFSKYLEGRDGGDLYDKARKKIDKLDLDFTEDDKTRAKTVKEVRGKVDTKVTSQELAKHRGRDLVETLDSSDAKGVFEKNKNKLSGKKESIIDPLTKPLKERMTAEKKEIIQGKLKEKAEKAAQSQASIAKHAAQAKHLKNIRNIKRGAGVAAATIGTAGLMYGVKKLHDKKKKED